jgi:hypothetical protein
MTKKLILKARSPAGISLVPFLQELISSIEDERVDDELLDAVSAIPAKIFIEYWHNWDESGIGVFVLDEE